MPVTALVVTSFPTGSGPLMPKEGSPEGERRRQGYHPYPGTVNGRCISFGDDAATYYTFTGTIWAYLHCQHDESFRRDGRAFRVDFAGLITSSWKGGDTEIHIEFFFGHDEVMPYINVFDLMVYAEKIVAER